MERLFYERPTLERKDDAIDYINEHLKYNSNINGVGSLDKYLDNYEGWLVKLEEDKNRQPTEERVPGETFFLVRESDNKIVGMVNIRWTLNKRLRESGGHIGYGIRPTERRKGYNKINLYLALEYCQNHGIDRVMLTCDKENVASSKTMLALGAKFEKEQIYDGDLEENYWIDINESLEKYRDIYAPQIGRKR